MATESNAGVSERDEAVGNGMKTFRFRFTINPREYAARFGVVIPDDAPDELVGDAQAGDSVDADTQDATVNTTKQYVKNYSQLYHDCKTPLDQCKAKNPMTCPYHGARAIAMDVENTLRAAGIAGNVTCELQRAADDALTVLASVVAPEQDEQKVRDAMKSFFALPGVTQITDMDFDKTENDVSGLFEIDMLDPNAKARWGKTDAQTPIPDNAPKSESPKPVEEPKKEEPKTEEPPPNIEQPQSDDDIFPPEDTPELYPASEPPPLLYTEAEIDSAKAMVERLLKTARQINNHIAKNETDSWIGKSAPNLPKSLQKYKDEVDPQKFRELAAKDNVGEIKEFEALLSEIEASEANGWKDLVAADKWDANAQCWWETAAKPGNIDMHFDASKYDDPYKKEREAYRKSMNDAKQRERAIESFKSIDASNDKSAPKDALKRCREAAQDMTDLEDGFKVFKEVGISDPDVLKIFAQAYYLRNEKFGKAVEECRNWLSKQWVMQDTVDETIAKLKSMGEEVPEEMLGWAKVEKRHEDKAWESVARRLGLNYADKDKNVGLYSKNMKAYLTRCPIVSYYHFNHVRSLIDGSDRLHANTNSYVNAANAAFGTKWTKHCPASEKGMHLYAKVHSRSLSQIPLGDHYNAHHVRGIGILFNPKKAVISYVNAYLSSVEALSPRRVQHCSATFANNPTCCGVSCCRGYGYWGNVGSISKEAFEEDLSQLPIDQLHKRMGLGMDGGEAWAVGGAGANQILAMRDYYDEYTKTDVKKFNDLGITILDGRGQLKGKDCIEDEELRYMVFDKEK